MKNILKEFANLLNSASNDQVGYGTHFRSFHHNQRIYNEIMVVAPMFVDDGGIYYDEENYDWIMIPEYSLPDKWADPHCKLLILLPNSYPDTPPIGFYLDRKLQLWQGGTDPHIIHGAAHGATDLIGSGWYWYCVTIENGRGGWCPSADYQKPDNLLTFFEMVRESLTNNS